MLHLVVGLAFFCLVASSALTDRSDDSTCEGDWTPTQCLSTDDSSFLALPQNVQKAALRQEGKALDRLPSTGGNNPASSLRAGEVCFFVNTDTANTASDARANARAVAETWAAAPAAGSRVYYFVDEQARPYHLPDTVEDDRIIKTIAVANIHRMAARIRMELQAINTKSLRDTCEWFALVEDDTYVNTASVVAKSRSLDASKPHYMGDVMFFANKSKAFVHGDFTLLSRAAVPVVAEAAARCNVDWVHGDGDVDVAKCFSALGLDTTMRAERFGVSVHDNNRNAHPNTLQMAADVSRKSGKSLACLDWLHKMLADDMRQFHEQFQKSLAC